MPIYEFKCEACGSFFEKLVFQGDEEHVECPECGGAPVKKMISSPSASGLGSVLGGSCASAPSGRFS